MADQSVPKIPPVIIPRVRWNEVEQLVLLAEQALGDARRRDPKGLEVASGCLDLLGKKVRAISWRVADDLEEWETEDEDGESFGFDLDFGFEGETCIVEVRLCEKDRRAIASLIEALGKFGKAGSK